MNINAQIPLPSFEDIRKILQFWIDQQDKWFYFETAIIQSGAWVEAEVPDLFRSSWGTHYSRSSENRFYIQTRIVGKINDVVSYPPSLLLQSVSVFTVRLIDELQTANIISTKKRDRYGLVFSQISYYEPIDDIESFLKVDTRILSKKQH